MLLRKRGAEPKNRRSPWADDLDSDSKRYSDDKENTPTNKSPDIVEVKANLCTLENNSLLDCQLSLTGSPETLETQRNTHPHSSSVHVLEAVDDAMDAAANKLVRKALRFMSLDDSSPPQSTVKSPSHIHHRHASPHQPSSLFSSFTDYPSSIFDKGLDAITGVGKFVEDVAVTLDTVIGQAFEEWGSTPRRSPSYLHKDGRATSPDGSESDRQSPNSSGIHQIQDDKIVVRQHNDTSSMFSLDDWNTWGEFDTARILESRPPSRRHTSTVCAKQMMMIEKGYPMNVNTTMDGGEKSPRNKNGKDDAHDEWLVKAVPSSAANGQRSKGKLSEEEHQWRRRAQILQRELQKVKAHRDEYQRLKDEYDRLKNDLSATHSTVDQLSAENCRLRLNSCSDIGSPLDPVAAELIMKQMEALLSEKAALAQENDRLSREKAGLQELLHITMFHQVQEAGMDDELFLSIDSDCSDDDDDQFALSHQEEISISG